MIEIVPASAAGLTPLPRTARAFAMVRNGEVLGHAGVYLHGARYVMYANLSSAAWAEKRAVVRGWRHLIAAVKDRGLPIYATADPKMAASARFLEHLGFARITANVYRWEGN